MILFSAMEHVQQKDELVVPKRNNCDGAFRVCASWSMFITSLSGQNDLLYNPLFYYLVSFIFQ